MLRRPPRSTLNLTLFPHTSLFRTYVLDLSQLLTGLSDTPGAAELDDYLDFAFAGGDTTITINVNGAGGGTDTVSVVVQGENLTNLGASDQQIIQELLDQNALQVTSRSEEHTSELQSLMRISYAVFCLKKKKK